MPSFVRYDHSVNEACLMALTDDTMQLFGSLSEDTSALATTCAGILGGNRDQDLALSTVALRLEGTLSALRTIAHDAKNDARFMVTIAEEVRKALTKICALAPLVLKSGDDRIACLHPVLDVGESLNSLYHEVGIAIC